MNNAAGSDNNNHNLRSYIAATFSKIYLEFTKICRLSKEKKENDGNNVKRKLHRDRYSRSNNTSNTPLLEWINLLNRSVFLVDNSELGRIEAVNQDSIVIKTGSLRPKRYYITRNMLRRRSNKTTSSSSRSFDSRSNNESKLFLDLMLHEVTLYESNKIPNPNVFVTLGASYNYIPQPYSNWRQQQDEQ